MNKGFILFVRPPEKQSRPALWFAFLDSRLLVREEDAAAVIPCVADIAELGLTPVRRQYLGTLAGRDCYAAELGPNTAPPADTAFQALRGLYGRLDEDLFSLAGRAFQIVEWDRTHHYCGRCGALTGYLSGERARECPACGLISYPRLSPAVIVLVQRGNRLLLARNQSFPHALYSVLAGFVEPGESLEEAVEREVYEEVRLEIEDIRYFGSQPWPYPHSLMIGFTASHASGEIHLDERELADAGWFTTDDLPHLPGKPSIARSLIDWFVSESTF